MENEMIFLKVLTSNNKKLFISNLQLTQYGHHHVVPEDLYRTPGNEV